MEINLIREQSITVRTRLPSSSAKHGELSEEMPTGQGGSRREGAGWGQGWPPRGHPSPAQHPGLGGVEGSRAHSLLGLGQHSVFSSVKWDRADAASQGLGASKGHAHRVHIGAWYTVYVQ